jgi:epoxyqueuosine reductase
MSLLHSAQRHAARHGLNLFGLVDAKRFDNCQPREQRSSSLQSDCGTIVVLATAGRSLRFEFQRQGRQMPEVMTEEQVDELALAGAASLAAELAKQGLRAKVVDARRSSLNMGQLAEAAGFGIVSPVSRLLLHPQYGPWLRVRAAVLLPGHPFGEVADASIADCFRPCCNCAKPCIVVCPSAVHDGAGNTDRARCAGHRHRGGCASGCHSRMACPIGAEHADAEGQVVHAHSITLRTVQRWFGLGWWRMVPRVFRGGPRT